MSSISINAPWKDFAACAGMNTEIFFDMAEADPIISQTVRQSVCGNCPVQDICLEAGIENKEWGIWGGEELKNGQVVTGPDVY